jgi:SPP1 gp7 family putative phage head morphogenesis protein
MEPNFAVNPTEAIEFFRQKLNLPTTSWTDIWEGMHARAFVVAGANTEALVADFRNAIDKTIAEGKSLDWFRKEFDKIVAAHGWNYKGERRWRQAVIFNTNLRMAYATGRWAQIKRLADRRPYLRYVAVMDDRTRPLHRAWHDLVLRWDHPFWETHFPPNGWNCRCSIQQLSERDLTRLNLKVAPHAPASSDVARSIKTPDGIKYVLVPKGIDPGFAYNPGEAAFGRGAQSMALEKHSKWTELLNDVKPDRPLPRLPLRSTAEQIIRDAPSDEASLRDMLRAALGGDEALLNDPTGNVIQVGQAIIDHWLEDPSSRLNGRQDYLPLLKDLILDPEEIWIGFATMDQSGKVGMRRRYVKLYDLGKGKSLALICDADGHLISGLTFLVSSSKSPNVRTGLLVFRKK